MLKVDKEKIKKKELVSCTELSDLTGIRATTLSHYGMIGLLKYQQGGTKLMRRFPVKENLVRLEKILELKKKGKNLQEITKHFN